MRVVLGNDHAAVELKNRLKKHMISKGYEVNDVGIGENETVDYPDIAQRACAEFLKGGYDAGIVCCGTGIGVSISANKINGIRCALPQDSFAAKMARMHNDANFIAFGGRINYHDGIEKMLDLFLNTPFDSDDRHKRRVKKITALE